MKNEFLATDIPGHDKFRSSEELNSKIINWLSRNLRRRKTDTKRRYQYILSSYRCVPCYEKRWRHLKLGVKILSEEDIIAFKLRWM